MVEVTHLRRRKEASPTRFFIAFLRYGAIMIAVFIAVFPLCWIILASFKRATDLTQLPPAIFFNPTLANYVTVVRERFFTFFRNSVIVTVGSVLLSIALGVPAAYGLSRFSLSNKKVIMFFVLSVRFVPYIVFGLPLFLIMANLGLVGTRGGVTFVYILINLPIIIWLMKTFFDDIPTDIDEAAAVDGATRFQTFRMVILPCAGAGIACVTILSFIFAWNEYLFALLLSGRNAQTLTVGLTRFLGGMETGVRWGLLSAWSVAVTMPVVVIALLVHKYLREGFTRQSW